MFSQSINILHCRQHLITCSPDPPWIEANHEKKERKSSRRPLVLAPLASSIRLPSTTLAAWIFTRIFIRKASRTGYPIAPSKLTVSSTYTRSRYLKTLANPLPVALACSSELSAIAVVT